MTIWSKQSAAVLRELEETGRYIARRERIAAALGQEAPFFLPAYDWLRAAAAKRLPHPGGEGYPIWVTLCRESAQMADSASVIIEAETDEACILHIDIVRWTAILDCAYLPLDETDAVRHRRLLEDYATNDIRAVTTPFYPQIRAGILKSWERLFDIAGDGRTGIVWELRQSQIVRIISPIF